MCYNVKRGKRGKRGGAGDEDANGGGGAINNPAF